MAPANPLTITISHYKPREKGVGLVDIFARIANQPWSMLLDTCGSTKSDGRFNIMLWSPAKVITAKRGETHLQCMTSGNTTRLPLSPFEATNAYLHSEVAELTISKQNHSLSEQLPFLVGVAGMAGYDTGRYYEALPTNAIDDYATPDFAVGLYLHSLIEDSHTGEIFYCSTDGTHVPNLDAENHARRDKHVPFALTCGWQSNLSPAEYSQRLDAINKYLIAGDCYQVNMAQRFSAKFNGDVWDAYVALRNANQAPFSAYIQLPQSTVISISPERFIKVSEGRVETKPIKGTRPRFTDPAADAESAAALLSAQKDRAENLMIVDLLRNDISKHCKPHSVDVPHLFALESYEAVHHLVSTVVGELNDNATPLDLLASAFPGGSITGAPKIRAMEIIDELEVHRRNIYCGSIFYMGSRSDLDSSICIRTLLAENNQLHCWAGGGIVLDSKAHEEYQETLDKVSKILPVLEDKFG
ncbi:aminodeoxychorismate synthase component I [Alteromonas sp. 345S023]|uniref:aminodeoxychorismate synthase n=1 Tax=Alteromonas profundi TaxID=2696062 RepID=A0A7X5LL19_9ALTE|nr:aminodeoxychorismate synthase component I [Alteromonas profundi]NDV91296.1 aminodeoxychorismate synthase component I [Alteromonas profundi]